MKHKVLIAFGSRYGATRHIAEKMAELFSEKEYDVEVMDVKEKTKPDSFDSYDMIVVGSGIKIGRWTKEAESFLDKIPKSIPLGLFVSCGDALNNVDEAKEKYVLNIVKKHDLAPIASYAFGPIFDFTPEAKRGFLSKNMIKRVATLITKNQDKKLEESEFNDYVDWDNVNEFVSVLSTIR